MGFGAIKEMKKAAAQRGYEHISLIDLSWIRRLCHKVHSAIEDVVKIRLLDKLFFLAEKSVMDVSPAINYAQMARQHDIKLLFILGRQAELEQAIPSQPLSLTRALIKKEFACLANLISIASTTISPKDSVVFEALSLSPDLDDIVTIESKTLQQSCSLPWVKAPRYERAQIPAVKKQFLAQLQAWEVQA